MSPLRFGFASTNFQSKSSKSNWWCKRARRHSVLFKHYDNHNLRDGVMFWRNWSLKNGVFWDVTPCGSCKNRRFGGTWRLLHQMTKIGELGTTQAATSNRLTLRRNTLMKEAPGTSETSVLTRATQRNNTEDTILHSHRRENLKSYTNWSLFPDKFRCTSHTACKARPAALVYNLKYRLVQRNLTTLNIPADMTDYVV
jgi:hypothetical protein